MSHRDWTPAHPRICSRCAVPYDEPWRVGCPRCGGVVIANEDRGLHFRIIDRAKRDGWERGADDRSASKAKRWQEANPPTHRTITFPLTTGADHADP